MVEDRIQGSHRTNEHSTQASSASKPAIAPYYGRRMWWSVMCEIYFYSLLHPGKHLGANPVSAPGCDAPLTRKGVRAGVEFSPGFIITKPLLIFHGTWTGVINNYTLYVSQWMDWKASWDPWMRNVSWEWEGAFVSGQGIINNQMGRYKPDRDFEKLFREIGLINRRAWTNPCGLLSCWWLILKPQKQSSTHGREL